MNMNNNIVYDIPLKHFSLVIDILEDEYEWEGDNLYTDPDEDDYSLGLRAYRFILPAEHKSIRTGELWYGEDDIEGEIIAEYEENETDHKKFIMYRTGIFDPSNEEGVFNIDLAGKIDAEEFKKAIAEAIAEAE